jgi:hypothetical protein
LLSASFDSESNSYWMGLGTTHFFAVIKVTYMYRSWKNMFVKLRISKRDFRSFQAKISI